MINQSATIVGATWGKADDVFPYALQYGFKTGFIPALLDGSMAADGDALTNEGCATSGATHNGAESLYKPTDASLVYSPFYSDDQVALTTGRDWAYIKAYVSALPALIKWGTDKYGSCMAKDINTYADGTEITPDQYPAFPRYYKQGECSGGISEALTDETEEILTDDSSYVLWE